MTLLASGEEYDGAVFAGTTADEDEFAGPGGSFVLDDLDLRDCRFDDCTFSKVSAARTNFDHVVIRRSAFESVKASNSSFVDAALTAVEFRGCQLSGLDISSAMLKNVVYEECRLVLASFRFSRFTSVTFRNCDLTEADFQGMKAVNVNFERCRFEGTEFSQASVTSGAIRDCEIGSLSGITGLAGITVDVPALMALAPALALAAGFIVAAPDESPSRPR